MMYCRFLPFTLTDLVPETRGFLPHPGDLISPEEGDGVVGAGLPPEEGLQLPGRHWEYHWFWALQHAPETQVVPPVHPWPPPIKMYVSRTSGQMRDR